MPLDIHLPSTATTEWTVFPQYPGRYLHESQDAFYVGIQWGLTPSTHDTRGTQTDRGTCTIIRQRCRFQRNHTGFRGIGVCRIGLLAQHVHGCIAIFVALVQGLGCRQGEQTNNFGRFSRLVGHVQLSVAVFIRHEQDGWVGLPHRIQRGSIRQGMMGLRSGNLYRCLSVSIRGVDGLGIGLDE